MSNGSFGFSLIKYENIIIIPPIWIRNGIRLNHDDATNLEVIDVKIAIVKIIIVRFNES